MCAFNNRATNTFMAIGLSAVLATSGAGCSREMTRGGQPPPRPAAINLTIPSRELEGYSITAQAPLKEGPLPTLEKRHDQNLRQPESAASNIPAGEAPKSVVQPEQPVSTAPASEAPSAQFDSFTLFRLSNVSVIERYADQHIAERELVLRVLNTSGGTLIIKNVSGGGASNDLSMELMPCQEGDVRLLLQMRDDFSDERIILSGMRVTLSGKTLRGRPFKDSAMIVIREGETPVIIE